MKNCLKRALIMTLATILLIGTFAVTADAAMKRTVKKQNNTYSTSKANKKASKVKKGTTNLVFTKGAGYLKFTAPSTKTYSFTFSNIKTKGVGPQVGFYKKVKNNPKKLQMYGIKTKGGESSWLWLLPTREKESDGDTWKVRFMQPLHKRTGKLKLKKGEVVYIWLGSDEPTKTTAKLVIK